GVDLTSMGEVTAPGADCEVLTHTDPATGVYRKLVLRDNRLVGAILLGAADPTGRLLRLFKEGAPLEGSAADLLTGENARDALLGEGARAGMEALPDETQICNCHSVSKGQIVAAIREGKCNVAKIGECTRAGTGCGTCQPLLGRLLDVYAPSGSQAQEVNK